MKTLAEIGYERLANVLVADKNASPNRAIAIIKSEVQAVLESYLELEEDITVNVESEKGKVVFTISAVASRVKDFGSYLVQ